MQSLFMSIFACADCRGTSQNKNWWPLDINTTLNNFYLAVQETCIGEFLNTSELNSFHLYYLYFLFF